jgi:ubiquinone/menaquinone biosynthesis C-methylase UbiE
MMEMTSLLEQAGRAPDQSVLDVGFRDPGELQDIATLVGPRGHLLGIDDDPETIEPARKEMAGSSVSNVAVKEGSVLCIPAGDLAFDLVLCKGIRHEVRQLDNASAEIGRVCKEGGLVSILDSRRFAPFGFRFYQVSVRLHRKPCVDVHPGFSRRRLSQLLSGGLFEQICYRRLPDSWYTGPFEARASLVRAR